MIVLLRPELSDDSPSKLKGRIARNCLSNALKFANHSEYNSVINGWAPYPVDRKVVIQPKKDGRSF
jgi:hypothetical protein